MRLIAQFKTCQSFIDPNQELFVFPEKNMFFLPSWSSLLTFKDHEFGQSVRECCRFIASDFQNKRYKIPFRVMERCEPYMYVLKIL